MVHVRDLVAPEGRQDPHQPGGRGPVRGHPRRAARRGRPSVPGEEGVGARRGCGSRGGGGRRGARRGRGPGRGHPPRRAARPDPWSGSSPAWATPATATRRPATTWARRWSSELADPHGERFRKVRFLPVETADIHEGGERVMLARSTRFMNEAGPSYASLAKKQDVDLDHLIAVHDELDIRRGHAPREARRKPGRSQRSRSLQQALRSPDFLRVRGRHRAAAGPPGPRGLRPRAHPRAHEGGRRHPGRPRLRRGAGAHRRGPRSRSGSVQPLGSTRLTSHDPGIGPTLPGVRGEPFVRRTSSTADHPSSLLQPDVSRGSNTDAVSNRSRRWSDAEPEEHELALPGLHGRHAHDVPAGGRREVEEPLSPVSRRGRSGSMRLRKTVLTLGWLASMAIAMGAFWKNW